MGSSKYLILQNTTMAEGKQSIKNKFIKPFVALFRKNKKDKEKANEIATKNKNATTSRNATANRNATTNQSSTINERHEEAPYDNLLKKLEELEINKRARLENAAANIDNDSSICDSDSEADKGICEKFDKEPENDVTTPRDARNDVTTPRNARNDVTTPHITTNDDSACDSDDDHAELLEKFNQLEIVKKEVTQIEEDEEELKKFSTKIVPDDVRTLRNDSQSSQDSGFAEKSSAIGSDEENIDKDVDRIEEKGVQEDKKEGKKQKKLQKAYLKRGPVKSKRSQARPSAPYEINLNPQHHCGGQVIFNAQPDFDLTLEGLNIVSLFSEDSTYESLINSVLSKDEINKCVNALQYDLQSQFDPIFNSNSSPSHFNLISIPQLSIPEVELPPQYEDINENVLRDLDPYVLTPPSSVNSQHMYEPQNRNIESPLKSIDTPESPALSLNESLEQFGEIASNDQYFTNSPTFDPQTEGTTPQNTLESPKLVYEKLKHYKDRQMELAKLFSKMECCQIVLKPCKEIFNEHLQKLQEGDRKKLCYSVANLELQFAFGVLMNALSDLSKSERAEDVRMALFCLVCEKVLSAQKTLFVEDFGLKLLKFAVLRCYKRPVITRYLVECVRVVTRSAAYRPESDIVFTEVDALGDNLLIACVREGDKCASALRELVRRGDRDAPLFDVHHVNTEGYTALHVCCAGHGARTPRAHTLHVLLQHAAADRRRQDRKGGETPLHLAVNSAQCELDMILIFFLLDRKDWYSLAHIENRSGKKPLDYAKFGKKSRPNYPPEILDFLNRCRK